MKAIQSTCTLASCLREGKPWSAFRREYNWCWRRKKKKKCKRYVWELCWVMSLCYVCTWWVSKAAFGRGLWKWRQLHFLAFWSGTLFSSLYFIYLFIFISVKFVVVLVLHLFMKSVKILCKTGALHIWVIVRPSFLTLILFFFSFSGRAFTCMCLEIGRCTENNQQ